MDTSSFETVWGNIKDKYIFEVSHASPPPLSHSRHCFLVLVLDQVFPSTFYTPVVSVFTNHCILFTSLQDAVITLTIKVSFVNMYYTLINKVKWPLPLLLLEWVVRVCHLSDAGRLSHSRSPRRG